MTLTFRHPLVAGIALAATMWSPAFLIGHAQQAAPAQKQTGGFPDLVAGLKATPGCLGVETARTTSGKMVIFAWFENKKAALAWYYSQTHQMLVKMGGGVTRPRGPMADVPDDGKPIMAIASVVLARPQDGIPPQSGLPPVSQIAIELYTPLPGGLALGGRFAPVTVNVPGLLYTANTTAPTPK